MVVSVNTNVAAMRGQHRLSRAVNHQAVSMKRLSSGHKIHSAKDDPAGLQISSRLQAQNRGLDVAIRNANDGISMLQTAEGAMGEYTENLMRMRDLTLRYANGSLSSEDRGAIQQEYNALKDELNRITETTSFGGQRLLNGTVGDRTFQIGSGSGEGISVQFPKLVDTTTTETIESKKNATRVVSNSSWRSKPGDKITLYGNDSSFWQQYNMEMKSSQDITVEIEPNSSMDDVAKQINEEFGDIVGAVTKPINGVSEDYVQFFVVYSIDDDAGYVINTRIDGPSHQNSSNSPFYKGQDEVYAWSYKVDDVISKTSQLIPSLDTETPEQVIDQLDQVLKLVDSERAKLGAAQNRLSHAINNLSQTSENVAASNSQIRDTDFVKEATELTKQSILKQVNTSMLAQANSSHRGAINLLG